jgi:hypothetical protein
MKRWVTDYREVREIEEKATKTCNFIERSLPKDEEKQLNPSQPQRDALDITAVSAVAGDKTTL